LGESKKGTNGGQKSEAVPPWFYDWIEIAEIAPAQGRGEGGAEQEKKDLNRL
jgi:hypothetical protein